MSKHDIRFTHPRQGKGLWFDGKKVSNAQIRFLSVLVGAVSSKKEGDIVDGAHLRNLIGFSSTSTLYEQAQVLLRRGFIENVAPEGSKSSDWRLTKTGFVVLQAAEIGAIRGFVNL